MKSFETSMLLNTYSIFDLVLIYGLDVYIFKLLNLEQSSEYKIEYCWLQLVNRIMCFRYVCAVLEQKGIRRNSLHDGLKVLLLVTSGGSAAACLLIKILLPTLMEQQQLKSIVIFWNLGCVNISPPINFNRPDYGPVVFFVLKKFNWTGY